MPHVLDELAQILPHLHWRANLMHRRAVHTRVPGWFILSSGDAPYQITLWMPDLPGFGDIEVTVTYRVDPFMTRERRLRFAEVDGALDYLRTVAKYYG